MKTKVASFVILFLVLGGGIYFLTRPQATSHVNSYSDCVAAGYPVMESDPPQCRTPEGKTFVGIMQNATPTLLPETPTVVEENIIVEAPNPNTVVGGAFDIKGMARVFENSLNYRVKMQSGKVVAEGFTEAKSPDVGQFGPFSISIADRTLNGRGTVEVFSYSAKDGSEINMVKIPVIFTQTEN